MAKRRMNEAERYHSAMRGLAQRVKEAEETVAAEIGTHRLREIKTNHRDDFRHHPAVVGIGVGADHIRLYVLMEATDEEIAGLPLTLEEAPVMLIPCGRPVLLGGDNGG